MNKHRSLGIYAFRTPINNHLNYGTKFRTLTNQGNVNGIVSMMHTSDTIATSEGCSYDVENYMKWAPQVYDKKLVAQWHKDYWLEESIVFWTATALNKLRKHYNSISKDYTRFRETFIPMMWTTTGISMTDVKCHLTYLTEKVFPGGIAIKNVAMEEKQDGKIIVYGRLEWLRTFRIGQQIINYYTMAKKFHEVYGF